ncbi:fatty acid desaturase [Shewanella surugensis]|uniref:Fatty acid desaturase n=1 Tax=Shewanella surugensis TaxID=212020 RepID=A0ABT0LJ65_9GAMM|nr:fatty acid desaturase [Shewanella surugensis]MCL1127405.1 fatty acid desaturase [Shewanella surugensis]
MSVQPLFYVILTLLLIALLLQIIDHFHHLPSKSKVTFEQKNTSETNFSYSDLRKKFSRLGVEKQKNIKLNNLIGVFPFIWTYLYIIISVLLFSMTDLMVAQLLLVLFVTGRFRSLQEIGHQAIHGALMPDRKLSMLLTDILFQYPAFMMNAKQRRTTHVKTHHKAIAMPYDPDLIEMTDVGFKPGLTNTQFVLGVLFPLTPKGLIQRFRECVSVVLNGSPLRFASVAVIVTLFSYFGLYYEMIFLYIVPVFITYPLFYWIAHIALHRWYTDCTDNVPYHEREMILGRPTKFEGITGFIIKHNIFPIGDSYHLAHSLHPTVRWNYLPQVDTMLRNNIAEYANNESVNLFFPGKDKPSALSELKETMVSVTSNKAESSCQL